MSSLLEQLENNEAILLMYLAGELPESDRAEVEQMLASDAKLRAELEQIRASLDHAMSGLAGLDVGKPISTESSVRGVMRAITRRQMQPAPAAAIMPPATSHKLRWVAISFAAAAMIVVGTVAWWSQQNLSGDHNPGFVRSPGAIPYPQPAPVANSPVPTLDYDDQIANSLAKSPVENLNDAADQELVSLNGSQEGTGFLGGSR